MNDRAAETASTHGFHVGSRLYNGDSHLCEVTAVIRTSADKPGPFHREQARRTPVVLWLENLVTHSHFPIIPADLVREIEDPATRWGRADDQIPYRRPDEPAIQQALARADDAERASRNRTARAACMAAAVAVRDILTGYDDCDDARFEAVGLELRLNTHGRVVTDGTYWTASGRGQITDHLELHGLREWTGELDVDNRDGWAPLCKVAEAPDLFVLDLARAATIPADPYDPAHTANVRARLGAVVGAPWSVEEIVFARQGGRVHPGDPDAVHTDFLITDRAGIQVAEISVQHDGPEDTETPAEDLATSRAHAELIRRAPQDMALLLHLLDQAERGAFSAS